MWCNSIVLIISFVVSTSGLPFNSLWYDAGIYGSYLGQNYHSFPLVPPALNFLRRDCCDLGYTFLTPQGDSVRSSGPLILDADGELVWMSDEYGVTADLRVQSYRGEQYLTFWAGADRGARGNGSYYMLDSTYEIAYIINPNGDLEGDLHEFNIVGDTALITTHQPIPANLFPTADIQDVTIYDAIFQEIDIASGELKFQWRSSDHFNISDSFSNTRQGQTAVDYFHMNSVDKDESGNYYVSSANMHSVICISPSGLTKWILGGTQNQFTDLSSGAATNFSWQNNVRWHGDGVITLLDNGASSAHSPSGSPARGLKLRLDVDSMTATLLQSYLSPVQTTVPSYGSLQVLDSGNVFIDWGSNAGFSEYSEQGEILCDAHFGAQAHFGKNIIQSRRGYKGSWIGQPNTNPDVSIIFGEKKKVFVSWNGATKVAYWRLEAAVEAGTRNDVFIEANSTRKTGFESMLEVPEDCARFLRLVALDQDQQVLGMSEAVDGNTGLPAWQVRGPIQDDDLAILQYLMVACSTMSILAILVWHFRRWAPGSCGDDVGGFDDDDADDSDEDDDAGGGWWANSGVVDAKESLLQPPPKPPSQPEAQPEAQPRSQSQFEPQPISPTTVYTHGTQSRYMKFRQAEREENTKLEMGQTTPQPRAVFKYKTQSRYMKYRREEA